MKEIGVIASGSSFTEAWAILREGMEKVVRHEDLCLIKNLNGNEVIAVVRDGRGIDENLVHDHYTPSTGRVKIGYNVPSARRHDTIFLDILGEVTPLRQNRVLIAPQSRVYLLEDQDNPMKYLVDSETKGEFTIGYYYRHPNWRVPVKPEYACYHIGVFGATGCGKTMLVVNEIIPLLLKARYHVLIMDWKGSGQPDGYANFFPDIVIKCTEIRMEEDLIVSFLSSRMRDFGYTGEKRENNPLLGVLETVVYSDEFKELLEPTDDEEEIKKRMEEFRKLVEKQIWEENKTKTGELTSWGRRYLARFRKYFSKLKVDDFKVLLGRLSPDDIIEKTLSSKKPVVVDLGLLRDDQKLMTFLAIANAIKERIEKGQRLNLALIIDEGAQYCPFRPRGIQKDTTEIIKDLCATGRSAGLSVVLVSQGIAGEIGISASIRRNLNTLFIGRIGANDLSTNEVRQLLQSLRLNADFLRDMRGENGERLFYFMGAMSPVSKPLLITFDLKNRGISNEQ